MKFSPKEIRMKHLKREKKGKKLFNNSKNKEKKRKKYSSKNFKNLLQCKPNNSMFRLGFLKKEFQFKNFEIL